MKLLYFNPFVLTLGLAGTLSLGAAEWATVGIGSGADLTIKPGDDTRAIYQDWQKEPKKYVLANRPVSDEWETLVFSVTPEKDTYLSINLQPNPKTAILFDDVRVNGEPLSNGSFETWSGGHLTNWNKIQWNASALTPSEEAADGKFSAKLIAPCYVEQRVNAKANTEYTISVKVKLPNKEAAAE